MNKLLYYLWYPIPKEFIYIYFRSLIIYSIYVIIFSGIFSITFNIFAYIVGLIIIDTINIRALKRAKFYENPF